MNGRGVDERLRDLIMTRTGLFLRQEEQVRLSKAIAARIDRLHLSTSHQYWDLLNRNGAEWEQLIPLVTTGETYFLRDQGQCEVLEKHVLPQLIERNGPRRSLRIWSAGCATGEEPYSLAILIDKLLPSRSDWDILVLGTDINAQALDQARSGRYGAWSFRMLGPDFRGRYFHQQGDEWAVDERIRTMVTFLPGNLVADGFPNLATPLHGMDLIVCRNVFIYFRPETVTDVIARLALTLVPGGFLLTGHAELQGQQLGPLQVRVFPGSVVYERDDTETQTVTTARRADRMPPEPPRVIGNRASPPIGDPVSRPADPERTLEEILTEAQRLLQQADYRGAIGLSRQAALLDAHHPRRLLVAAQAHANVGEHEAAVACCHRLLERNPFNADGYYLLAHLADERGDVEEAKALLKKVLYIEPSSVAAHLELGTFYDAEGDVDRAVRMRIAALQLLKTMPADARVPRWPGVAAGQLRLTVEQVIAQNGRGRDPGGDER